MGAAVASCAPAQLAFAAPKQTLTISPVSAALSLNPGARYQGTMTVANQGNSPATMTFYVSPYFVTGEQYSPIFSHVDQAVRADTWVHVTPQAATVAPQGVVTLNYTVSPPANARPGGYYAAVFAQASSGVAGGGTVGFSQRAGEILYITVNGPATYAGDAQFSGLPALVSSVTLSSSISVHNAGSVHFQAQEQWSAAPIFGGLVDSIKKTVYVLPGTTRQVTAALSLRPYFGVGVYKVTRTATFLNRTTQNAALVVAINPAWALILTAGIIASLLIRYKHVRHARGRHV